jgi:DnaJ family protein C protein 13
LCIGGVYIRLLLEAPTAGGNARGAGSSGSSVVERLPAPREFFAAAHHRLLCLGDASLLLSPAAAAAAASSSGSGGSGASFFSDSSSNGRQVDAEADRELCVRAMAAAYHVHAGAIGPVEGITHLAALFNATPSRALRWVAGCWHWFAVALWGTGSHKGLGLTLLCLSP